MHSFLPLTASLISIAVALHGAPVRHLVQLSQNRFQPATITARAGDTLRFVNGRGGPHNVEFLADSLSDAARKLIDAAMPGRTPVRWATNIPLASPLMVDSGEVYQFVVPALEPGPYQFFCTPHVTGGMRGQLIVIP
jgi:plastocyanin